MTDEPALAASPRRLRHPEQVARDHGRFRAALLAEGLGTGDPVADDAFADLAAGGAAARRALAAGLREGLSSLQEPPPAGIAALLRESEEAVAGTDRELLERGDVASIAVDPFWSRIAFALGSLVHTYSAPAIARVLTGTGKLTESAGRRLGETGLWRADAILPGGLLPGADGYVDSVQVRLLHARVRAAALRSGWDTAEWGVPINSVDVARTWLDFTVVPFRALEKVGIVLTDEEERDLYRYWHCVAALIGVDPRFYTEVVDHASAEGLLELVETTNGPPDEGARALVHALLDALATGPMGAVLPLRGDAVERLLHALTRLIQGDEAADGLGLGAEDITPFVPLLAMGNSQARRWERATEESWEQALHEHTEFRRTEFAHLPGTEYRSAVEAEG
ncbi:oxygenase MpaB family protein [Streptomonospora litoralis]|uniref:Latex clearing protein n=1 Tax=Streptomonospora litoralis TaxID=2498135 RepID=A0A4P6Q3Y6_9ACTN|nr:oxygenase MpaB family protein [Streptomonospora litoralis]QBI53534.1 Latex clearing protein precursor [Streptomonospora litoralis]